ncbi:major capsid protein, partial [Proteus mirabilis]|uniref:major capsid protein n=1 Tax=Proteus mirabilis TaxID=584 RepID=UPI0013A03566
YGDDRKLAPFVVPNVAGRPQRMEGFEADTFTPAYSKQKDIVDYTMHIERQAGEALGGSLTIEQRRQAVIAELLRRQKVKINNTWNWLGARAIIDGKVTIEGEDYPSQLVDFRRHPDLTIVLTGAAKWD